MSDGQKLKERRDQVQVLKTERGIPNVSAEVIAVLDFSQSMSSLYRNGTVQRTLERILGFALAFDDDGQVEGYLFHDDVISLPTNLTTGNMTGYVDRFILGNYTMGGTKYAPVINEIVMVYGKTKGGFMGLGARPAAREIPAYVLFITDGENYDKREAENAIREASRHGIFFQFVGIGHEQFKFLQKLDDLSGREIDNADFFKVASLDSTTDEQLYRLMMTEFPGWIANAKTAGLLR